jgi:hypothetical protein
MCVHPHQVVVIGIKHQSDVLVAATNIEGQRPVIHDNTDTGPREAVC